MTHPLCGCANCRRVVAEMREMIERRSADRVAGVVESIFDITYRVCREAETSKLRT